MFLPVAFYADDVALLGVRQADENGSNSPNQARAGLSERVRFFFSGLIILTSIAIEGRHKSLSQTPEHLSILVLTDGNRHANSYKCLFVFFNFLGGTFTSKLIRRCHMECLAIIGLDSASTLLPLQGATQFLSVTNAPESGPLERVSRLYFISLFLTNAFIFLLSDSFWKCGSALREMDGQRCASFFLLP